MTSHSSFDQIAEKQDSYARALRLLHLCESATYDGVSFSEFCGVDGGIQYTAISRHLLFEALKRIPVGQETVGVLAYSPSRSLRSRILSVILIFLLHTQSIMAIVYAFFIRAKVLVYTNDIVVDSLAHNDPRISAVYRAIAREKLSYIEIVHTVPSVQSLKNIFIRKRPVIFYETLVFFSRIGLRRVFVKAVQWNASLDEATILLPLVEHYFARVSSMPMLSRIFCRLCRILPIHTLVGIDDVRYIYPLIVGARRAGVATEFVQHGHLTKYHVGWLALHPKYIGMIEPDRFYVWNKYWKRELARLGGLYREETVYIGGYLKAVSSIAVEHEDSDRVQVIVAFETVAPQQEVLSYILQLIKEGVRVFLKVRADVPVSAQLSVFGEKLPSELIIVTALPGLTRNTVLVGVYSTYLYDCLTVLPVMVLDTSMDYGMGMVVNGLASRLTLNGALVEQILYACKNWSNRRNGIDDYVGDSKGLMEDSLLRKK